MRYKNYVAKVTCFNCRKQMRIKIPMGEKIYDHPCPKCGTTQLVPAHVKWD